MSRINPPSIASLTAGYLGRTEDAETLTAAADALGDVQPHEVTIGYRAEPRLAWQESLQVLAAFGRKAQPIAAPAEWGGLVAKQDGLAALPFALANYPQRVRDLANLLGAGDLGELLPKSAEVIPTSSGLSKWGDKHIASGELPHVLIVAATYRAARDFDRAQEILNGVKGNISAEWKAIVANEEAALLWHRGDFAGASEMWAQLPDSPAVQFNRGMASLFLGRNAEAKTQLAAAIAGLPETSAWHHLASLYLSLAEMRG